MRRLAALVLVHAACGDNLPSSDVPGTTPPGDLVVSRACVQVQESFFGTVQQLQDAGANLVWLGCDSSIMTTVKDRGLPIALALDEPNAKWLASDGRYAYWARAPESGEGGEIVRVALVGGKPEVLASDQSQMYSDFPDQMVVDDTTVFRSMFSNILAMPNDGSASQRVFAVGDGAPLLAADSASLYWVNDRTIQRQGKDGTGVVQVGIAPADTFLAPIAVTDRWLYFWTESVGFSKVDKLGGIPETVPVTVGNVFAVDGDQLYAQTGSTIFRLTDDGSLSSFFVNGGGNALVVDADYLYWPAADGIRRTPKL